MELARLGAAGDQAAFRELLVRASRPVGDTLRRMGASPALADDIAQDAFLAAWRSLPSYRGEGAFAGWVIRIAGRLYLKRVRKDARYQFMAEPPAEQDVIVPLTIECMDLDRALDQLTTAERLCVTLCHGAGFTHEDIAEALKLPLGTVKSHVRRGVLRLRSLMTPPQEQRSRRCG